MADQKTTDAAVSGLVKTYYDKRLVERLEPKTMLMQFGEKRPIPAGTGKTIEFTGWRNSKPIAANSGELSSTQIRLSAYTISASLIQRHQYAQFSTLLRQTSIDPNVKGAVDVIADNLAKTVELYLRATVVGAVGTLAKRSSAPTHSLTVTNTAMNNQGVITGTSAQRTHTFWSPYPSLINKARLSSSGATIGTMAGSAISFNAVKHGVSYLKSRDVESFDGGDYVFYGHPWVIDVLMNDPKWATWNAPQNARQTMFRGEVGRLYGARVVQSNMAFRYVYSAAPLTTASGAFNASFLIGKGAFGVTELDGGKGGRGFEIIIKNPGPGSTNDPADLIHTVAGKMVMAAAVLNKSAGACIISTDKVVTSGT